MVEKIVQSASTSGSKKTELDLSVSMDKTQCPKLVYIGNVKLQCDLKVDHEGSHKVFNYDNALVVKWDDSKLEVD